jgi:hypothetical protein
MAQWSNQDASSNSVLWAPTSVNLAPNTTNRDNLFGNTTADAFITGETVGQFGVDTTEVGVSNGSVIAVTITSPGSGYTANATVTVSNETGSGFTANAEANATGYISAVNISAAGSSYETIPTITISAPSGRTFNANSAVANTTEFITISSNVFQNNDIVTYTVATGNTVISGLTNGTSYFAVSANSTGLKLASTRGGTAINITAGLNETGHTLTGQTATAVPVISSANKGIAHSGWNLRTVGSGGRAGRIHYETLVAMGSMLNADADAEDTVLKDV